MYMNTTRECVHTSIMTLLAYIAFLSECRIGQKNEVHVYRIITTSPVEERILSRATDKKHLNSLVVEAGEFHKGAEKPVGNGTKSSVGLEGQHKQKMESVLREWSQANEANETGPPGAVAGTVDGTVSAAATVEDTAVTTTATGTPTGNCEHDNEVPNNDQLNNMMAVLDGEMTMYGELDLQRELDVLMHWAYTQGVTFPEHLCRPIEPAPLAMAANDVDEEDGLEDEEGTSGEANNAVLDKPAAAKKTVGRKRGRPSLKGKKALAAPVVIPVSAAAQPFTLKVKLLAVKEYCESISLPTPPPPLMQLNESPLWLTAECIPNRYTGLFASTHL